MAVLAACGGGESDGAAQPSASYPVAVTTASFPAVQRLGETSLLRLGVRNAGDEALPALTVTVGIEGERGGDSALPFGVRDPQPGLAAADRPVWVLAATYPRLTGSSEPGGATTSNPKTFNFGPLRPGETTRAVWKLSAVRTGRYTVGYRIGAGEGAAAENQAGGEAAGSLEVRITSAGPDVEVTDDGEVVRVGEGRTNGGATE